MHEPIDSSVLLKTALPAATSFLLTIEEGELVPILWVEGHSRPDVLRLQQRLTAIGRHHGLLASAELEHAYGQVDVRWIYAYGAELSACFLQVCLDLPSLSSPRLTEPALRTEFLVLLPLQGDVVPFLSAVAQSRRLLLHFDEVPDWMRCLPAVPGNGLVGDNVRVEAIIASSLILGFQPEVADRLMRQLEAWTQFNGSQSPDTSFPSKQQRWTNL